MSVVFPTINAIVCRACGATYAEASDETMPDVCVNCWGRFVSANEGDSSIDAFDRWLARKLLLDLKRLNKNGVVGRCEALSHFSENYRGWQQQCASVAVMKRDGRLVCRRHGKIALECTYVEHAEDINGYGVIGHLIRTLAAKDAKLLATVREAIT